MESSDAFPPSLYLLEAKILSALEALVAYEGVPAGLARAGALLQAVEQGYYGSLPPLGSDQGLTNAGD